MVSKKVMSNRISQREVVNGIYQGPPNPPLPAVGTVLTLMAWADGETDDNGWPLANPRDSSRIFAKVGQRLNRTIYMIATGNDRQLANPLENPIVDPNSYVEVGPEVFRQYLMFLKSKDISRYRSAVKTRGIVRRPRELEEYEYE